MAAGLTVDVSLVETFRRRFTELTAACRAQTGGRPVLDVDLELGFRDLKRPLLDALSLLEPHGCGNPHPVFVTRRAVVSREPEVFGERHLRLHLSSESREIRGVGFRMAHLAPYLWRGAPIDVAYTPETRQTGDRQELSLNIKDLAIDYRVEDAPG
jgi:single-stranded-DNA-specific exonuclease